METHEHDPTTDQLDGTDGDSWEDVSAELGDLKTRLSDTYRKVAGEGGPSEEEIREAVATLAGAWDQVAESVATALQDPEVRETLKTAAGSLASAFGRTMSELGSELADGPGGTEEE